LAKAEFESHTAVEVAVVTFSIAFRYQAYRYTGRRYLAVAALNETSRNEFSDHFQ